MALTGITYAEQPIFPAQGTVSSSFGWRQDPLGQGVRFHGGLDIAANKNTPIYATQRGVVAYSGLYKGYGNVVVLAHGQGLYTVYGHTATVYVHADQVVEKGQLIAVVGSTGRSTGNHLHFEVRHNGQYVNPIEYLSHAEPVRPIQRMAMLTSGRPTHAIVNLPVRQQVVYRENPYTASTTVFTNEEDMDANAE